MSCNHHHNKINGSPIANLEWAKAISCTECWLHVRLLLWGSLFPDRKQVFLNILYRNQISGTLPPQKIRIRWTLWDQLSHSKHRLFFPTEQTMGFSSPISADWGTRRMVLRANFSPCLLYALYPLPPFQSETVFFLLLLKMMLCVLTRVRVKFPDL